MKKILITILMIIMAKLIQILKSQMESVSLFLLTDRTLKMKSFQVTLIKEINTTQ